MKKRIFALFLCLLTVLTLFPVSASATNQAVTITQQPANCFVAAGELASTTVVAEGTGLTYQWYLKNPWQTKFYESSLAEPTYYVTMTEAMSGRQIYCIVKDKFGNSVKSKVVTLKIPSEPSITQQPEDCHVAAGEMAITSVAAEGKGLTYQWYLKNPWQTKFYKSSLTEPTYYVTMTEAMSGRQVYCVVTDMYGKSETSNVVTLKVPVELKIISQPKSARAACGSIVSTSVTAQGEGITYQWYCRDKETDAFTASRNKTSTYSSRIYADCSGFQVYCVITDQFGNSVQTNVVRLYATGSFKYQQYNINLDAIKDLSDDLTFTTADTLQWNSSNPEVATVNSQGIVTAIKKGSTTITATGVYTGIMASCKVAVGPTKQVALTFDDGPSTHTARFLDYLATTDAKVTFFMVGNRMNSYKTSVKRMAEQGHELGYHSYDHYNQTKRSSSQIASEYNKSNTILQKICGQSFTLWRTPGGNFNDRVLNCVPLPHIYWTSSTADWQTRNETSVYNAILKQAKDGSIILLHDLYGTTVDAAIRAMKKLEKEGYEFVTVTELLSRDGTPPKASVNYRKG